MHAGLDDRSREFTKVLGYIIVSESLAIIWSKTSSVNVATDRCGHILDLVLTRTDDDHVSNSNVTDAAVSGHLAILCKMAFRKPSFKRKEISYRNNKSVVKQKFYKRYKELSPKYL